VTESLVSSIDLTPTILELAGVEKPETVQGVSMLPILNDPEATTRDVAFAEQNWHVYFNHSRMVRAGDYLYIRNNAWERLNVARETFEDSVGQELWTRKDTDELTPLQRMIFRKPQPKEELFRVSDDPYQGRNLAKDPEHHKQLEILRGLLETWTDQTGDTFPDPHRPDRQEYPGMTDVPDQDIDYEVPGESAGATEINNPGPIKLDQELQSVLKKQ
jgi:arylsulfatase